MIDRRYLKWKRFIKLSIKMQEKKIPLQFLCKGIFIYLIIYFKVPLLPNLKH